MGDQGKNADVPMIKCANGHEFPIIGLGTVDTTEEITKTAVRAALDAGYRLIDTAFLYRTEKPIGEVIAEYIKEGKVKREELFIVTKLPANAHRPEDVRRFFDMSLKDLGLDYVDLYLNHWPMPHKRIEQSDEVFVPNKDGDIEMDDVDLLETWKAMETLVDDGLAKSIGLSNCNSKQVQRVHDAARIKPANLQVECHPYLPQNELIALCKKLDISFTAFSPLGTPGFTVVMHNMGKTDYNPPKLMEDEKLKPIAEKHKKTVAQVLLKFNIQRGIAVIPKSKDPERIKENFNVFDFTLDDDDLTVLKSMESGLRYIRLDYFPGLINHAEYPFNIPY